MDAPRTTIANILRCGWLSDDGDCKSLDVAIGADRWPTICDVACRDGLAGLLLTAAKRLNLSIPNACADQLGEQAMRVAAANLHRRARLRDIAAAFSADGLELMTFKGMALLTQVYRRAELRPMGDIDLMIRPSQVNDACRTLERLGCRTGPSLLRDDFFPRLHYEREYHTPAPQPIKLDVHARPLRPAWHRRHLPDDALWENRQTIDIAGVAIHVPSPEIGLIHLLAHAALHGGVRLLWFMDIALYVRSASHRFDWSCFLDRVETWRLTGAVRAGLRSAETAMGPIVPQFVRERINRSPVGVVERVVLAHAPHDAARPVRAAVLQWLTMGGIRSRAGYLAALLWPGRRHLAGIYARRHRGWTLVASFVRWIRPAGRLFRVIRRPAAARLA